ncbi:hypothetical protein [Chamaesiphon minutus]|uniref:Phytanoyl-CoA dioxygenase (PhyH) n=1 Tax=Chamaesiphon minutus (strain ATCC 27169 / PCC 6605) TaxID=1173020 RepID=K9URC4_CHAP6|nr:hypothetical protein [Chamaesiphon minutus]AFY96784.1 hypothetical protein Cha6605_5938 [Chamaesiphon minutus PCC 6605]
MRANTLFQLQHLRFNNLYPLYHLINRFVNKILSLPSDLACLINSNDWFERWILLPRYQQWRDRHQEHLPKLEASELAIVEQLEQEGICITSLEVLAIPDSQKLLDAAEPITKELAQLSRSHSHAGKHTLMANADLLLKHPEILEWGLSKRILKIVECYLGLPVGYGGLSFYYSVADGRDAGPRIWHRDKEDWRMIKVAVYLNDVDESGGPYQCVTSVKNRWLLETLPRYKGLTHSEMQQMLNNTSTNWFVSCVGKAGTVIFTDTSRYYHRGKPPIHTDRSAIFFHYFSYRPKNPFFCDRSPLSSRQIVEFDKQLPPELQGYLTWRDKYPIIGRYIPKNYMRVDNW